MFNENGTLKAKGKYAGKERDSLWTFYDGQGKIASTENYVKGKKDGLWKVFYPNGSFSGNNYSWIIKPGR
jgi:antitoxin component YwqK of YwqJK toxin-antitoxin module